MNNKVVIFARSIPAHNSGGLEVVTWDMCKGLAKIGLEVELITTKLPSTNFISKEENINIVEVEGTIPGKYNRAWWEKSAEHFLSYPAERLIGVISVSAAGFGVLKYRNKYNNVNFIMQAHGTSIDELKTKIKSRSAIKTLKGIKNVYCFFKDAYYYKKFDYIVGIGDAVVKSLTSFPNNLFVSENKVVKIENGIDESLFSFSIDKKEKLRVDFNIAKEKKIIISVCRLHEQKGVDNNIRVVKEIVEQNKHQELLYIICGSGPAESSLKSMVQSLSLNENIIFVGDQDRVTIAKYLNMSDVFMFLTKRIEGLPLNVLEAQASGLPMIISKHLFFEQTELVNKVDNKDIKKAAEILIQILSENNEVSRKSYINEINTLDYSTKLYHELLNRK